MTIQQVQLQTSFSLEKSTVFRIDGVSYTPSEPIYITLIRDGIRVAGMVVDDSSEEVHKFLSDLLVSKSSITVTPEGILTKEVVVDKPSTTKKSSGCAASKKERTFN